jgi:hypothetical protein
MTLVYIIGLYCLAADPPNPWDRRPARVEAPACFEHREEYAGDLQTCSTRGVLVHHRRLAKLHDRPFAFAGTYCREVKR